MTKSLSSWMCAKNYWDMFKWVSHRSLFVIMACGETQGYEYQHKSKTTSLCMYITTKYILCRCKKSHSSHFFKRKCEILFRNVFVWRRRSSKRWDTLMIWGACWSKLNLISHLSIHRRDKSKLSQIYICAFQNAPPDFSTRNMHTYTHIHTNAYLSNINKQKWPLVYKT